MDESLSKPTANDKSFLLAVLNGTVALVSKTAYDTDDYDTAPRDIVAFEHIYF